MIENSYLQINAAWQKFGNGETPSRRGKGDKLVGNYYVAFDKAYKVEIAQLISEGKQKKRLKNKHQSFWKHKKCY
jgi:arginyl-tRNA synthetase